MVELKTLKDLTIVKQGVPDSSTKTTDLWNIKQVGMIGNYCYPNQLRQEAIKWAKMFNADFIEQKKYRKEHLKSSVKGRFEECLEEKLDWIIHFFNITAEELKNG